MNIKRHFSIHKLLLIILINTFPKTFKRYAEEYKELMETVFKEKKIK
jgi:hypothetical protein